MRRVSETMISCSEATLLGRLDPVLVAYHNQSANVKDPGHLFRSEVEKQR